MLVFLRSTPTSSSLSHFISLSCHVIAHLVASVAVHTAHVLPTVRARNKNYDEPGVNAIVYTLVSLVL